MSMFRLCVAVPVLAVGAVLVPVGAPSVAAQPAASGGVVVIANGWSPPDIGAAAPLAGRLGAVVLYSSSDSLGSTTVAALERLQPARVVLMGGPAALSDGVSSEVRSTLSGVEVQRLSGTDRVDTVAQAALLAPEVPEGRPVVIANGWSPPDVGAAAPLADSLGGSVLFAQKNALGDATVDALRQLSPSRVVIVGGTAALSADIEAELESAVPGVPTQRLGGVDRTDTAARGAELSEVAVGSPVVIASGWSSPDVGVAAPLAAAIDGTVLFSYGTSLGEYTSAVLRRLAPKQVTLVGDTDAVPQEVQAEVAELLPSATVQRIAGNDRKATAADAALYATGDSSVLVTDDKAAQALVKTSIAVGSDHTCWLRPSGTIACRGSDRFGRTDAPYGKFIAISAGQTHNCGLRTDRTITCWGAESRSLADSGVNFAQTNPPSGTFTAVAAGQFHSCGLREDKTIACWGADQPGDEPNYGQSDAPAGEFAAVDAGFFHTCAIGTNGRVACWGNDEDGQSKAPDGKFKAIASGGYHSCGIRSDKTINCWGNDDYGQLAAPKGTFSTLAAGAHFTCGLRTNDTVKCWGYNGNGQTDALGSTFESIEAGHFHACGVRVDERAIDCWGHGATLTGPGAHSSSKFSVLRSSTQASCGILESNRRILCWGLPRTKTDGEIIASVFTDVPEGRFKDILFAGHSACGLRADGQVRCWGRGVGSLGSALGGAYRQIDFGLKGLGPVFCGLRIDDTLACSLDNGFGSGSYWFSGSSHRSWDLGVVRVRR